MSTRLSKNFTLEEFAVSGSHPDLVKPVPSRYVLNVVRLVETILQPARGLWGKPLRVLSGYRSDALNRAVAGSQTSQHRRAEAADLESGDSRGFFEMLMRSDLPVGQVIWYPKKNFVHVALPSVRYPKPSFFYSVWAATYKPVSSPADLTRKLGV